MSFNRFSQLISYVLHPLAIPTIAVVILLFGNSVMSSIPMELKLFFSGIVVMNTLVIPLLSLGLFHHFRILPDLALQNRRERLIPIAILAICYGVCIYMLSNILLAFLILRFLYAALGCVVLALGVTYFWKISLHLTAMGGLLAMLMILNFSSFAEVPYTLILFILLTGVLASARLQLGYHNPMQVGVGFIGGFMVASTIIFMT